MPVDVDEESRQAFASDPDSGNPRKAWLGWALKTLSCVADCGIAALILILKTLFFAILPFTTLLSTLALPFLGCLPDGRLVSVGVGALVVYELAFLAIFGVSESSSKQRKGSWLSLTSAVILDSRRFWAHSLSLYFEKTRRCRGHLALMSPRRYKQYLRRHRFSILVHGTEAEHPVHLRVCRETPLISIGIHLWRSGYLPSDFTSSVNAFTRKSFLSRKMQWSDTVGEHDLGTLSSITLSVSLLGGVSGSGQAGPSRPDRGKAKNFFTALEDGAAEPEPTKRKRKRSGRPSQASTMQDQEGDAVDSSDDGGVYIAPTGGEDEEEETEDSDNDMVVDG
ncbi:hypothetical protein B0H10DRAFT_2190669, partial [Mycena sp. CBHHK59/15]